MFEKLCFIRDSIFKTPRDASLFKYSLAFPAKKNIREKKLESAYHHDSSPCCWPGDTVPELETIGWFRKWWPPASQTGIVLCAKPCSNGNS